MAVDHLSRLTDVESDDVPIDHYFTYGKLVSFLRFEAPHYAHITDFLVVLTLVFGKHLRKSP